jgi:hypothetical protein
MNWLHINIEQKEELKGLNLRTMLHKRCLLHSPWHYDATITSFQKGHKVFLRCRCKTQPCPYVPQKWCVKDLMNFLDMLSETEHRERLHEYIEQLEGKKSYSATGKDLYLWERHETCKVSKCNDANWQNWMWFITKHCMKHRPRLLLYLIKDKQTKVGYLANYNTKTRYITIPSTA